MNTSNTVDRGPVNPSQSPTKIICPVEDTGKYSVSPSTIPRITAIIESCILFNSFIFQYQDTPPLYHSNREKKSNRAGGWLTFYDVPFCFSDTRPPKNARAISRFYQSDERYQLRESCRSYTASRRTWSAHRRRSIECPATTAYS